MIEVDGIAIANYTDLDPKKLKNVNNNEHGEYITNGKTL